MSDIQKKFYVLRAISGKENKVREYLEAELKNTDLGEYVSQVLIPTEKTFTVRNGKKVMKRKGLLAGLCAGRGCFWSVRLLIDCGTFRM